MATERRRQLLLGGLVVVLVVVLVKVWPSARSTLATPASQRTGGAGAPRPLHQSGAPGPPDVHLDALEGERPKPERAERNLFRFKPKAPPPPQAPGGPGPPAMPVVPTGPPPPQPLAPIALKFIGVLEAPTHGEKIAILSDGRNAPFYGKEGAIIEGRYRILKIGVESVELAYADGRGRQTIRLTGS